MRGAALAFEAAIRSLPRPPEILVTTDMLNLPELLGLVRDALPPRLQVITYFHENQITYPLASRDERDLHFGLANIYTALASDMVVFNSRFHRDEFLSAVPGVLKLMPDNRPRGIPERILERSHVLGVPVDVPTGGAEKESLILWNHRWEEDKDPEVFFRAIHRIDLPGRDFRIMVLGQSFRERPRCFADAERDLAHRIEHWGYVPSREEYLDLIARCRWVISTARHDFFGLAIREAILLGCYPLLPRRVVYPELVGNRDAHLYGSEEELASKLERLLDGPESEVDPVLMTEISSTATDRVVSTWDRWFDGAA